MRVCVWGGGDHHCCGSQGWLTLGSCQLSERRRRIKSSTQKSVCINNNHLLWPLVLHLQGVHCGFCVCMWRVYHNVYATPFIHPHPPTFLPDPPPWASSASWMTVSMWQGSLKWKGSRMLAFCASFTKLGFHPFHSVCQWQGLWMKAFETMPGSAASDQWASAMVRCSLRWLGFYLKESQQPFWSHEAKRKC